MRIRPKSVELISIVPLSRFIHSSSVSISSPLVSNPSSLRLSVLRQSSQVMSLNATAQHGQVYGGGGAAASSTERAPRLNGVADYASWQQRMKVWLAQRGAGDVLTRARTVIEWSELYAMVQQWAEDDEIDALNDLRSNTTASTTATSSSSSSSTTATAAASNDKREKSKRIVRDIVERSQRACGHLYASIPEQLQLQVQHLPPGFAYGLWNWIENKFQSKETDNVNTLLAQWNEIEQQAGESFDAYFARRVNRLSELLTNAGEKQSERMYAFKMLERLQPHFKPAILALQTGDMLKKTKSVSIAASQTIILDINWDEVKRVINSHERNELRISGEGQVNGEQALAAIRHANTKSNTNTTNATASAQRRESDA